MRRNGVLRVRGDVRSATSFRRRANPYPYNTSVPACTRALVFPPLPLSFSRQRSGSHESLLNPRNLCRSSRVAHETRATRSFSPSPRERVFISILPRATCVRDPGFAPLHCTAHCYRHNVYSIMRQVDTDIYTCVLYMWRRRIYVLHARIYIRITCNALFLSSCLIIFSVTRRSHRCTYVYVYNLHTLPAGQTDVIFNLMGQV